MGGSGGCSQPIDFGEFSYFFEKTLKNKGKFMRTALFF
jgi:hypothetical protein